jgi:hypothetical protein
MHYLKHLAWIIIGEAIGLGVLTGVGGNGAIILVASLAGAIVLMLRDRRAAGHFAIWTVAGTALIIGSVLLLATLSPTCAARSCAWVGPTGDAVPLVITALLGANVVSVLLVAIERPRRHPSTGEQLPRAT